MERFFKPVPLIFYRIQLTVMMYNENFQRSVKLKKDGTPCSVYPETRLLLLFPKL
jgi:hypothetical protein